MTAALNITLLVPPLLPVPLVGLPVVVLVLGGTSACVLAARVSAAALVWWGRRQHEHGNAPGQDEEADDNLSSRVGARGGESLGVCHQAQAVGDDQEFKRGHPLSIPVRELAWIHALGKRQGDRHA